ncbi:MAG: TetR/AcrR family transcriptional regulator [Marinovum algicola]|jgi:AcrR family transcriptional regulator|uniref:Transcriptional regulator, TetR family n=1 Tax=Marinovum algicola TaxID=42444 RepID=A0A975ZMU0_9RHOB|nr:TetR/AcrR family transcriptional regulator [Marinovum algicola]SEJ21758.1 transcriptional regulator, TetR family [Marinovum algicola]SLN48778.1 Nucleoid occlusion factor SlmA [Marinovum algicola]
MATALAPRKAPRQARSRKTRDAILVAAGGILAREGLRGLTTNHVARAAGISIGSLYQYYPNKQAIIGALLTESRAAVLAGMEAAAEAAADAALDVVVCAMVRARLRQLFEQPGLTEALERAEAELPADQGLARQRTQVQAQVVAVLAEYYVDDPETVARDVLALAEGMAHAALRAGEAAFEPLAQRVERAVTGYLAGVVPEA